MKHLLEGVLAGIVATFAMTLAKMQLFPLLRDDERYPLPPREITQDVVERTGRQEMQPAPITTATIASHFAFGAGMGAVFTALGLHRRHPVARGTAWGLGIWLTSYLGWVPAARILTPATRHPVRRNALMIAVHVVWGAAAGYSAATLRRSRNLYNGAGPLPDRQRR